MRYGSRRVIGWEIMLSGWSSVRQDEAKNSTGPEKRSKGGLVSRWRPGEFIFLPVVQVEVQVVSSSQNLQRWSEPQPDNNEFKSYFFTVRWLWFYTVGCFEVLVNANKLICFAEMGIINVCTLWPLNKQLYLESKYLWHACEDSNPT